jgi:NADH/NAD ratio-sensing transcriptional regulator Rex
MKTNFVVKDVKPYSMKQLCDIYQISDKTMRKWLKPFSEQIGQRQGHIYNVAQIAVIFSKLGVPGVIE